MLRTLAPLSLCLSSLLVAGIAACAKDEGSIAAPVPADAGNESGTVAAATPSKPAGVLPSGTQRGEGLPYEIAGTEVWTVPDPVSGRDYQVFVSLPASYAERPDHRYPVLYVTDADYAFPVVRNIARRLNGDGPAIEDFILIGLSYALGDGAMTSRRRDYTPTPGRHGPAAAVDPHGEGAAYAAYLRDQVLPFVASRFRSDEARQLLLGHSYGGLLGAQILFSEPALFSGYVLGSPSFWYDGNAIDDFERRYAAVHADLPASVYMYIGEYESPASGKRYDMVGDARRMEATLAARGYPSLRLRLDVLEDEDHLTVAPRGFIRGLRFLLGTGQDRG
ncbi:alpha/beta hydrolase-fold protein [Luteimonas sp. MJ246]|uniref:alpha/beta hydrolase n=1 Tax=Luteimonas sp. MJ174 TaxID=3129237 RepID=UPI0031BBB9C5